MKLYLKFYLEFLKISIPFCKPDSAIKTILIAIFTGKAHRFTMDMIKFVALSSEEKLDWYVNTDRRI